MNHAIILAQVEQVEENSNFAVSGDIVPIDALWSQITSLGFLEALTFISFGAVCLFYGWRVFRLLVVICFALLGMAVGIIAAGKISGESNQILGGVVGLVGKRALLLLRLRRQPPGHVLIGVDKHRHTALVTKIHSPKPLHL